MARELVFWPVESAPLGSRLCPSSVSIRDGQLVIAGGLFSQFSHRGHLVGAEVRGRGRARGQLE